MGSYPQPTVLITPEGRKMKPPMDWKPFRKPLLIILAIFIIGGLIFGGIYFGPQLITRFQKNFKKAQNQPKITSKGTLSNLAIQDKPRLFYVGLEYNPKTGNTTQLKTKIINSEPSPLFPSLPKTITSAQFVFKVELISDKSEIVQSGWVVTFKKAVETPQGTFRFGVAPPYRPNYIIKIYLPDNKLIWVGRIKEPSSI